MKTEELKLISDFMDKETSSESFIPSSSWDSLIEVNREVMYYELQFAYDDTAVLLNGKCPFECITEALIEMDRDKFEKSILDAILFLNSRL